jgi:hypothetical protein
MLLGLFDEFTALKEGRNSPPAPSETGGEDAMKRSAKDHSLSA